MFQDLKVLAMKAAERAVSYVEENGYDPAVVSRFNLGHALVVCVESDFYGDIVIMAGDNTLTIDGSGVPQHFDIHDYDITEAMVEYAVIDFMDSVK